MSKNAPADAEISLVRSRFIAGLIGPVLLAIAASMMINQGLAAEIAVEVARDKALMFMSGLILLVAGLGVVQLHPIWEGWPAVITLVGWLSVASGLARVLFPFELADLIPSLAAGWVPAIATVVCAALGSFLTYRAFKPVD